MQFLRRVRRSGARAVLAICVLAALTACRFDSPATTGSRPSGTISVFAAASLSEALRAAGGTFARDHPGVTVTFNFQSSSALATQIEQAAPADVFASADSANMDRLVQHGLIASAPMDIALNVPVIVVPAANRAQISTPKDLAEPGVKLVLAGPDVPIGNYVRAAIDRLAVDPAYGAGYKEKTLKNLVSNESNARAVLAKVQLGEADAGIVYRTDALLAGAQVVIVAIPQGASVTATYSAGVLQSSRNIATAAAFVAYLRGTDGQRLLREAGFDPIP